MHRLRGRWYGAGLALLALVAMPGFASDRDKEQRWADQIVDFLVVGEAVWLEGQDGEFLGLYAEAASEPAKGAAVVIHGLGAHPDWQDVVAPLRAGLPEHGWATLSIQMPILANDAELAQYGPLFAEVPARLDAAVRHLQAQGHRNIVLVAHSLGTAMSASYLAGESEHGNDIRAFVGIGMRDRHGNDQRMDTAAFLREIQQPMLDLYGSQDREAVDTAPARLQAGERQGTYEQQEVPGTDHFFRGKSDRLLDAVAAWLEPYARQQSGRFANAVGDGPLKEVQFVGAIAVVDGCVAAGDGVGGHL